MNELEKQVHKIFLQAEIALRNQTVFDGSTVEYFEDDAAELSLFPALLALNEIARKELKRSGAKNFEEIELPSLLACTDIYQLTIEVNKFSKDFPVLIELLEVTNHEDFQWNPLQLEPIRDTDKEIFDVAALEFRESTANLEQLILDWVRRGIDDPFGDEIDLEQISKPSLTPKELDIEALKMSWLAYPREKHKDSDGIIWELHLINEKIEVVGTNDIVHFHAIYRSLSRPEQFKVILLRTGLPTEYSADDDQYELARAATFAEEICSVASEQICTEIVWLRH